MSTTEDFETWFKAVEAGDGEIPLPEPSERKRWDEYVARHGLAWAAWQAALSQPSASAAIPGAKTQARHAIELIADWYEGDNELARAAHARRATDTDLLEVIRGVLRDLANTQAAYLGEKGGDRQRDEIARLKTELKTAKSPQADAVAALNKRLITANEEIDSLRLALFARGMEARSGETEGLDPEGATARPEGTRPEASGAPQPQQPAPEPATSFGGGSTPQAASLSAAVDRDGLTSRSAPTPAAAAVQPPVLPLTEALERIDVKAEAGLCYYTLEVAREFLKDIREAVADALNRERPAR